MNWGIGGSGDLGAWLAEERYLYMARVLHSLLGHWSATLMSLQYIKHCSFRPARLAGWLAGWSLLLLPATVSQQLCALLAKRIRFQFSLALFICTYMFPFSSISTCICFISNVRAVDLFQLLFHKISTINMSSAAVVALTFAPFLAKPEKPN